MEVWKVIALSFFHLITGLVIGWFMRGQTDRRLTTETEPAAPTPDPPSPQIDPEALETEDGCCELMETVAEDSKGHSESLDKLYESIRTSGVGGSSQEIQECVTASLTFEESLSTRVSQLQAAPSLPEQADELPQTLEQQQANVAGFRESLQNVQSGEKPPQDELLQEIVDLSVTNEKLREEMQQMQAEVRAAEQRIREQQREIKEAVSEARIDVLTVLPNRRAFDERISKLWNTYTESETPFSVVLIDVDRFKLLNDQHGHDVGDAVLKHLGMLLKSLVGTGEFMAARYGGEEFIVLLPSVIASDAITVAEKVRTAVASSPCMANGRSISFTVSLGIADCMGRDSSAAVIKHADEGLYASKEGGRNQSSIHDGEKAQPIESTTVA